MNNSRKDRKDARNNDYTVIAVVVRNSMPTCGFYDMTCAINFAKRIAAYRATVQVLLIRTDILPWEDTLVCEKVENKWHFQGLETCTETEYQRLIIPLI